MKRAVLVFLLGICSSCSPDAQQYENLPDNGYAADVWADNWFALSVNGKQVAEDSVPITTERSFNAERFTFVAQRPFVLGLTAKDFKENDTGLEYIGSSRQQMGDGGVILQIRDKDGQFAAVSDDGWKCMVVHDAPSDKSCASEKQPVAGKGVCGFTETKIPDGWDTLEFDDSNWPDASIHSESAVSPKMGYDDISWDTSAKLIWGPDLQTNNTILCRKLVE